MAVPALPLVQRHRPETVAVGAGVPAVLVVQGHRAAAAVGPSDVEPLRTSEEQGVTRPALAVDGWRRIVGTPAEVAAAVRRARASGRLESMTKPQLMPGSQGQVYVHIRMRQPEPVRARRWPIWAVGALVAAGSTTVSILAIAWIVAHWQQVAAAGIVALVVLVGLRRRSTSNG